MSDTPWTTEDDAAILAGYRTLGTRALAQELGRTRNMIIGRARRLGLSQRRPIPKSPEDFAELLAKRLERRRQRRLSLRIDRGQPTKGRAKMSTNGKDSTPRQGVPMLDLQSHHCRSLLGYDTAGLPVYCGLPKAPEGGSYCYMHYAIYHVQTRLQRDRERLNLRVIKSGAWA